MTKKGPRKKKNNKLPPSNSHEELQQFNSAQAPLPTQNLLHKIREHPVAAVLSSFAAILVATATIGPATGYVLEKWHDTTVTIDFSGEIDQKKPFSIPLVIKNPSTFFAAHSPRISCWIEAEYLNAKGDSHALVAAETPSSSAGLAIPPGQPRNFLCNAPDNFTLSEGDKAGGPIIPIKQAEMLVKAEYGTWVPWTISRQVVSQFVMLQTSNGFRWIKGQWVASPVTIVWPPGSTGPWMEHKPKLSP